MMPEKPPAQSVPAETPISPESYSHAILAKVDAAWGSNVGDQGYANPYEVAARAYDALYRPEVLLASMDARARAEEPDLIEDYLPSQKLRPATKEALLAPLLLAGQTPDMEEFVAVGAHAILHDANVAQTILPGARGQIKELLEAGDHIAIWSAGYPEHQHRKLGKTGLYDTVAPEGIGHPIEITHEHGAPIAVETIIAPNKTTPAALARVREIAGDTQIVVVDDRVTNLRKFIDGVPNTAAAIWVQFGAHAQAEIDKLDLGENPRLAAEIKTGAIVPVPSIDQLASKVAELRAVGILGAESAIIFSDYDDTIGDNSHRRGAELTAVVDAIFARGWA